MGIFIGEGTVVSLRKRKDTPHCYRRTNRSADQAIGAGRVRLQAEGEAVLTEFVVD
jgi:hypothetical protein